MVRVSVRVGVADCCIQTAGKWQNADQSRDQNWPMAIHPADPPRSAFCRVPILQQQRTTAKRSLLSVWIQSSNVVGRSLPKSSLTGIARKLPQILPSSAAAGCCCCCCALAYTPKSLKETSLPAWQIWPVCERAGSEIHLWSQRDVAG